jgi:hypothetical protein
MPSSLPPADLSPDSPSEATSYFTLEQRRAGETRLGGQPMPKLPSSSPWGAGPGPGTEELIDRTEDSNTFASAIDEHDGGDDADHFIQSDEGE